MTTNDSVNYPDPAKEKRARFHQALGSLVDAFGWFDYNLGLKLRGFLPREQSANLLKADLPISESFDCSQIF
jgi:hypothetical protein